MTARISLILQNRAVIDRAYSLWYGEEHMSRLITRRKLITTGLAVAAGVSGLDVAARLANRYGLIPPDNNGIFGIGETLTYAAQRVLMLHHSLAREFNRSDISKIAPV